MRSFIISLLFLALTTATCSADEKQDEVLLIKMCGEESASFFDQIYGMNDKTDKNGTTTLAKYNYHYNKQNNTCFMLVRINLFNDKKKINNFSEELIDVNQKFLVGSFMINMPTKEVILCSVGTIKCESQIEYAKLVRPYMTH